MAFDVSLRDPGTGFDIALAAAAGGDATPGASFSLPFNPLDVPAADLDAIDDELAALLTTLVLA